ncbi:MAG: phage tail sheath subtilisin-like domain-containing protein [Anaerolineae bacterium]|nr:phage tail sheath subtilisin-like domain-containing protein [Anaerolineae bacterium]
MPVNPTFPGVYIEEVPSGVRTISAASTSVTAFVGAAKRGPVNKATRILSFADFERRFGGLDPDSEMSYAVRQFYTNGGSDAWVVRVAKNAFAALKMLKNQADADVLELKAIDKGASGNFIEVRVDYATSRPTSTFNLTLVYSDPENTADTRTETYTNLSMNSADPRYVVDVLKSSELVSATRPAGALAGLLAGTSKSAELVDSGGVALDIATLLDATHNTFQVSVNGLPPVKVIINLPADLAGGGDALTNLAENIRLKVVAAAGGKAALSGFLCVKEGNALKMTSGLAGEFSSVRVLPGPTNDCSTRLKLGFEETDAVGAIRPKEIPRPGTLTSGVLSAGDMTSFPDGTHTSFLISLDGGKPEEVLVGNAAFTGASAAAKVVKAAAAIQAAVRAIKPQPAFSKFTCTASGTQLVLASGTRGTGSSVRVLAAPANSIANEFHLLGVIPVDGANVYLEGGAESPFTESEAYPLYIGSQAAREGIFALDAVQSFNLLCLAGVSDPGILADAASYVTSRRAFMIVDPPADTDTPAEMLSKIQGADLPKSKDAAVYFPWIKIADPLKGGKLRLTPPSGTVAGLYARTDAQRGVWKAPAGTEATLNGVQGLAYTLTDLENGTLNPDGVNCLRVLPVFGSVAWGARTLRGSDQMADEYKYVPVRRTALFIEESLFRGLQWVVFEPNDEPLWAQIRLNVGSFMHGLFRRGAFAGVTPAEAYFVKCDRETTTQDDVNRGVVNILVGFAPLKPAEFVIVQIQQMAGQLQS